jgi:hypothetical protein
VVMEMASISPSPEAPVRHDLPSPRVGEDFRLFHRLNKAWKKYGLSFWVKQIRLYKRGPETRLEGKTSLGVVPSQGTRHLVSFHPRGPLACFFGSHSFSMWKLIMYFFLRFLGVQKVPEIIKNKKEVFGLP